MSETKPGYYVHQFPDERKIITLDVLNMELLSVKSDVEQLKELVLCQKQLIENQNGLIEQLRQQLQALDGGNIN